LPAAYFDRTCTPPSEELMGAAGGSGRDNSVTVIYGICDFEREPQCSPPLQVQSWPACERKPANYRDPNGALPERTDLTIRGVPAAVYEEDHRVEVYSGTTTVVIYANDRDLALRAAEGLQRAPMAKPPLERPLAQQPAGQLPPPRPEVLQGTYECGDVRSEEG
jgi:hypothetical protein